MFSNSSMATYFNKYCEKTNKSETLRQNVLDICTTRQFFTCVLSKDD